MQYKMFLIPLSGPESNQEELNTFLRGHKIIRVRTDLIHDDAYSFLVEYVENGTTGKARGQRVDYRELLPPEQFAVFVKLREKRKVLAEEKGLPVYAVFTNEQLAEMVKKPPATLSDLASIAGVGRVKVENFGKPMLDILKEAG